MQKIHVKIVFDSLEEREGKLFAFEFKRNLNSNYRFPGTFLENYPNHEKLIINPDNCDGFLGIDQNHL